MANAQPVQNEISYLDASHAPRFIALVVAVVMSSTILGGMLTLFETQNNTTVVALVDPASTPTSIDA